MSAERGTASSVHRARTTRRCDSYRCEGRIEKGERYTRLVCFPCHEAHGGTAPWVMKVCATCKPVPTLIEAAS